MEIFKRIKSVFKGFSVKFKSVSRNGFNFSLNVSDDGTALIFSTPIYQGEGSTPRIIKEQALQDLYFSKGTIETKIQFDDAKNQVLMTYSEELSQLNYARFHELLDELIWVAQQRISLLDASNPFDYEFVCVLSAG
ncbi:hypothetical protein SCG7109_BS_00020 [Chlamydiales bacterium SCGC AG-110-M15]|nr:hypothetical protein SCG7109_BS_00020 [Chlamydiales bacterium SCGC AG-110-M15]